MKKKKFFYTVSVSSETEHKAINQLGFIVLGYDNKEVTEPFVDDVFQQIKTALQILFGEGEPLQ